MAVSLGTTWHALTPVDSARTAAPAPQYALSAAPVPALAATPVPALAAAADAALAETQLPAPAQAPGFTAGFLEQPQPEGPAMTALPRAVTSGAAPVQVTQRAPRRLASSPQRHSPQRMAARAGSRLPSVKLHSMSLHPPNGPSNPWSIDYNPIAHTQLTRNRSEVRNEYLASREQVAAFTGEDSGSAYLARQAARPATARANSAAHAHNAARRSRHEPVRS